MILEGRAVSCSVTNGTFSIYMLDVGKISMIFICQCENYVENKTKNQKILDTLRCRESFLLGSLQDMQNFLMR